MTEKRNFGWVYFAIASIMWSFNGIVVKIIPWNGITISILSGLLGAAFTMAINRTYKFKVTLLKVLGALCYIGQAFLYLSALKMTTVGNAVVLQNSSIISIILLNLLILKKKPSKVEVLVCILLIGGVTLAFADQIQLTASIGNVLAILSGLFYGGIFVIGRFPKANAMHSYILSKVICLLLIPLLFTDSAFMTQQSVLA